MKLGIKVEQVFALLRYKRKCGFSGLKGWKCVAEIRHILYVMPNLQDMACLSHDVLNADSTYEIAASFEKQHEGLLSSAVWIKFSTYSHLL